jgi:hypothetical protein
MAGMSESVVAATDDCCPGSKVEVVASVKPTACRKRDRRDERECVDVAEKSRERIHM